MKTKFINISGKRFGSLIVIERVENTSYGMTRWKCKCDCGNITIAIGRDLRIGKHKSCGCTKGECIRQSRRKEPFQWIYYKLRFTANKYKRQFDITFNDYLEFTKILNCYYCNQPVIWNEFYNSSVKYGGYNIDRKDNAKGYTKENCVVCCSLCNHVKGNLLNETEMLKVGKVIAEIKKDREFIKQ